MYLRRGWGALAAVPTGMEVADHGSATGPAAHGSLGEHDQTTRSPPCLSPAPARQDIAEVLIDSRSA
jgi:hypothetical protein